MNEDWEKIFEREWSFEVWFDPIQVLLAIAAFATIFAILLLM